MNNLGDIVGQVDGPRAPYRGFRRNGGGFAAIDLPEYPSSWDARGINDLGQIVGAFTDREGRTHGYRATPTALRIGPPDTQGVTRISDASVGPAGPQGPVGPQGRTGPPGPAGPAGARGQGSALEATRGALQRASGALERAIVNATGGEKDTERQRAAQTGLAVLALAIDDVGAAIAFANAHPDAAKTPVATTVQASFSFPESDRGRNPSMQISLNNLNAALEAFGRAPGGELGGFRAKINSDIAAAANHIMVANHAPRGTPGRGATSDPKPLVQTP